MSRSVLFSKQPLPELTSNEFSIVRGSYIGISIQRGWGRPPRIASEHGQHQDF